MVDVVVAVVFLHDAIPFMFITQHMLIACVVCDLVVNKLVVMCVCGVVLVDLALNENDLDMSAGVMCHTWRGWRVVRARRAIARTCWCEFVPTQGEGEDRGTAFVYVCDVDFVGQTNNAQMTCETLVLTIGCDNAEYPHKKLPAGCVCVGLNAVPICSAAVDVAISCPA